MVWCLRTTSDSHLSLSLSLSRALSLSLSLEPPAQPHSFVFIQRVSTPHALSRAADMDHYNAAAATSRAQHYTAFTSHIAQTNSVNPPEWPPPLKPPRREEKRRPTSLRADSSVRRLVAADGNNVTAAVQITAGGGERRSFWTSRWHEGSDAHRLRAGWIWAAHARRRGVCTTTPRDKSDLLDPPPGYRRVSQMLVPNSAVRNGALPLLLPAPSPNLRLPEDTWPTHGGRK